jgi:hypothetical protein
MRCPRFLSRLWLGAWVLAVLAACAPPKDLPDLVVTAGSREEFTRFQADLNARFPAERLKDFETATRELQLDAMNRDIASAEAREADMLRAVNGKTVHAVTVLGWGARKARFQREIAEITRLLERDLKLPPSEAVNRRLGSEHEVLAQLEKNLAETERHFAELQSSPSAR